MLLDESEAEILKIINEIGKLESDKKKKTINLATIAWVDSIDYI